MGQRVEVYTKVYRIDIRTSSRGSLMTLLLRQSRCLSLNTKEILIELES